MKNYLLPLLLSLLCLTAFADESGSCGDNLTWTYTESTRTLTISGSGEMEHFLPLGARSSPWSHLGQSFTSVVIEEGVTSIGNYAFYGCSSLTTISIPGSVTTIGGRAFYSCNGLTTITVPNSVTTIGEAAFAFCGGLTNIIIPNSLTSIEVKAFYQCSGLMNFTIPNSVTSIGDVAFSGCCGLTTITIPGSVTTIGGGAFSGCEGLTTITIPNSVTIIGEDAFNCNNIMTVYSEIIEPFNCGSNSFSNDTKRRGILYVPKGTKELYARFDGWRDFLKIEETEKIPSAIRAVNHTQTDVKVVNDGVIISHAKPGSHCFIHKTNGLQVVNSVINKESEKIMLQNGQIYILTIGDRTIKFAL